MSKRSNTSRRQESERYEQSLRTLQVELVKIQRHIIKHDHKVLVIFEGRDAAGKDGTIKRITEHLSPRDTRVVALAKPSDKDSSGTDSVVAAQTRRRRWCCIT